MLKIENLNISFNKNTAYEIKVFEDFNIEFEENKSTAILGPNGCGKSTLMNIIAGTIKPDRGRVILDDEELTSLSEEERAKYIGRVHQNPSMGVAPSLSILENMSMANKKNESFFLRPLLKKKELQHYRDLLSSLDLGLENMMDTKVKYLSGGQRQSLSLIMSTMKNPKLILLDEHTAALDPKTSFVVMNKTRELIKKDKMTSIMISHNMRDALKYSDKILILNEGKVVSYLDIDSITEDDLNNYYLKKL